MRNGDFRAGALIWQGWGVLDPPEVVQPCLSARRVRRPAPYLLHARDERAPFLRVFPSSREVLIDCGVRNAECGILQHVSEE